MLLFFDHLIKIFYIYVVIVLLFKYFITTVLTF
uniref:NADH dehydrogenase subunit 1 n=1 Tax=Heterorhabditis bacteriophora TaxID=37862 RepID=A0A1I7W929_HETBA